MPENAPSGSPAKPSFDPAQFKKSAKGGKGPESRYLRFKQGSIGHAAVGILKERDYDVESMVETFLDQVVLNGEASRQVA